jgi:hypothetical protein
MNTTIVTAFFDIGRDKWNKNNRTTDFYMQSFLHYLDYPYKMVCFIDDRYTDKVYFEYSKRDYKNKLFIPINYRWLCNHIRAWKLLEREREIMNHPIYEKYLENRLEYTQYPNEAVKKKIGLIKFPENVNPEYNIINHSKVDFVCYAIKNGFILTKYTLWSDFGYFNTQHNCNKPTFHKSIIDETKFVKDKLTFFLRNSLIENDKDALYTLVIAREVFTGTVYGGQTELFLTLQILYHKAVDELHCKFMVDDDQHMYIRCYIQNPSLFDLRVIKDEQWPKGLTILSKDDTYKTMSETVNRD